MRKEKLPCKTYVFHLGVCRRTGLVTAARCLRAGQGVAEEKVVSALHRRDATKRCDATTVSPEGYGCGQPSASLQLLDDGPPACISSPGLASDCSELITVSDPVFRQTPKMQTTIIPVFLENQDKKMQIANCILRIAYCAWRMAV